MNSVSSKVFWPVVAVLGIWLAVLTVQTMKPPSIADNAREAGGPVVAFVHGDSLQAGMSFVQTLQDNMQMQVETREARLQEDAAPLQKEAQELLAYANTEAATQDELEIAQRRIMEIEEQLRALQMAAEQDVFVAEQNMKSILAEALRRNLEAHAEEEGIDFILNWGSSGEGVLYGGQPWDITADVLDRINSDQ